MKDHEILIKSFLFAKEKATPQELEQIETHIACLRVAPEDKEVLAMCGEFFQKIHHLLIYK